VSAGFSIFLQLRARLVRNLWRSIRVRHPIGRIATVTLLVIGLWGTLLTVFLAAFSAIGRESSEFFIVILGIVFAVFFLIMFLLLAFSNAILCFSSLFRSWEADFMNSKPVNPAHVFWHKTVEAMLYSLWAALLLCLPLIVAFGVSFKATWLYYAMACALFLAFATIPVHLGAIMAVLFTRLLLPSRRRLRLLLVLIVAAAAFFSVGDVLRRHWMRDREDVSFWLEGPLAKLNVAQNAFLPSLWLTRGLIAARSGSTRRASFFLVLLISNALFFGMVAYLLAEKCYAPAFHIAQDHVSQTRASPDRWTYGLVTALLWRFSPVQRMIILKDLKTFLRSPTQWAQFLVFFGVLLLYFLNVTYLQSSALNALSTSTRAFVNLLATLLTLATFTIRFALPMISLEGLNFWILGLLPIKRREILEAKFVTVLAGSIACGLPLILLSDLSLGVTSHFLLLHVVTLVVVSFGLSALAVGLGAIYPALEDDNPAKVAAGFAGTLNLVLSLGFVAYVLLALVLPNHMSGMSMGRHAAWMWRNRAALSVSAVVVTGLMSFIVFYLGVRSLERLEI